MVNQNLSVNGSQLIQKNYLLRIEKELSKKKYKGILEIVVIAFFSLIILAPIINIISTVIANIGEIRTRLFFDILLGDSQWIIMREALWDSFSIAFIAVIIDVAIGFPIAVLLTRNDFPGKRFIDFLVDLQSRQIHYGH